jgi:hypothetical protein
VKVFSRQIYNSQPRNALGINNGHRLAPYLLFYAIPQGNDMVDLVTGKVAVRGAGCTITTVPWNGGTARPSDGGVACANVAATTGPTWDWGLNATKLDLYMNTKLFPLSCFVMAKAATGQANTQSIIVCGEANLGTGFGIGYDCGTAHTWGEGAVITALDDSIPSHYNNGATNFDIGNPCAEKMHFCGVAFDAPVAGTSGSYSYSTGNGMVRRSSSFAYTINLQSGHHVQLGHNFGTYYGLSSTALAMYFNKILTLEEFALLYSNPWALVNPQNRKFFFTGSLFTFSAASQPSPFTLW